MVKLAKKRRKGEASDVVVDGDKAIVSPIARLPFELIAEILLYSTTPADVLSLSRTCKHFCATLVENPVAAFIWKRVRAQMKPPVPDPTKLGFSEPQLANFIYGGGNCVVRDVPPFCSCRAQPFCSRCAKKARTICIRRFLPGCASVEAPSVVRNICQSPRSARRLLNLQTPTGGSAQIITVSLLRMRSGYLGLNGRTPINVASLHHSSRSCTNSRQHRLRYPLLSLMAGYRWPGWGSASTTIATTYYRPGTSIIKPHFPK